MVKRYLKRVHFLLFAQRSVFMGNFHLPSTMLSSSAQGSYRCFLVNFLTVFIDIFAHGKYFLPYLKCPRSLPKNGQKMFLLTLHKIRPYFSTSSPPDFFVIFCEKEGNISFYISLFTFFT
jgi:hypothetical protein